MAKAPQHEVVLVPRCSVVAEHGNYYLLLEVPGLPKMMNSQGLSTNRFVLAGIRKRWKAAISTLAVQGKPEAPHKRARVRFTRFSSVCPDPDNLVAGFKPCLDGLVVAGIIEDDKWANVGMPEYSWDHAPAKSGHIRIEVWALR